MQGYFDPVLDWIVKFAWGEDFGDNGYVHLGFRRSIHGRDGYEIIEAMYATMLLRVQDR